MTPNRQNLRSLLEKIRDSVTDLRSKGYYYANLYDFVLREGQAFEPRSLPTGIDPMEPGHCINNSFRTAFQNNFRYVEGFALTVDNNIPLFHAWNLDRDEFVVDTTWNPHGRAYFGVIFPLTAIRIRNRVQYSLLDDWEHGYPILRKARNGEVAVSQ